MSPEAADKIGSYVQLTGGLDLVERLESDEHLNNQPSAKAALQEMRLLLDYCKALGIEERISFDLSLARGLDYYTGVIYEAVLKGLSNELIKCFHVSVKILVKQNCIVILLELCFL